ncbi:MAG: response regulator [Fusicatenibacter sp.]|nr:response regulator [Fusicatenibacter sp.]
MYTYLIVDDEIVERKGIRMLLGRMGIHDTLLEASNGEEALEVMEQQSVDILLTDINMPFMDGIELLSRVHEKYPALETVIFSGYDEFSYAKKAISYGVSAYILKPVNPDEFEKVIRKIVERLDHSHMEEKRKDESISFLKEHILYLMVNGQSRASLTDKTQGILDLDFVRAYHRMMLMECNDNCFEQVDAETLKQIREFLNMKFQYLNLNSSQSLLLFAQDAPGGWEALGRKLFFYLKEKFGWECFLAISEDMQKENKELSFYFAQTEQMMEQKFYHTGTHVFLPFREEQSEIYVQVDAEILIHQIQQDIRMKDIESLKEHFDQFCERYEHQTVFSQVYIKFMFSNLLKEIYDNLEDTDERELDREIDQLYRSNDMNGVIRAVRAGIARLEKIFTADGKVSKRKEVEQIKQYIRANYSNMNLGVDQMAREVGMTPNYLSSVFKKETGENLSRYLKNFRMEKAREMLENTNEKIGGICQKCGFSNVSYFCQSFRECYGISPQKYRDQGEGYDSLGRD